MHINIIDGKRLKRYIEHLNLINILETWGKFTKISMMLLTVYKADYE